MVEANPDDPPRPARRFALAGRLWALLNSGFGIAFLTSIVALVATQAFQARTAASADLAARRDRLERLVVELDLRRDRLRVVCLQAGSKAFDAAQRSAIGQRARAIVAGETGTVVSDPAFQDVHLASLLAQADVAAGLPIFRSLEITGFTDLQDDVALARTSAIVALIAGPIADLEAGVASGRLPSPRDRPAAPLPLAAGAGGQPLLCSASPSGGLTAGG